MKKEIKKIALSIFSIMILLVPIITLASTYSGTLSMSSGSLHEGKSRNYNSSNHRIDIQVDSVDSDSVNKLVIALGSPKFLGGINVQSRKVTNLHIYSTVRTDMGSIGSGNKVYGFGTHANAYSNTGGTGTVYGGFYSSNVIMTSY